MKKFTLPLEEAIIQTANWRAFYAEICSDRESLSAIDPDGENILRGFRISLESISQIKEVIDHYNADVNNEIKINSIRAYLAKRTDNTESLDDIHLLLVPVIGGEEIEPGLQKKSELTCGTDSGTDLLEIEDGENNIMKSTIYDFTTPCPTECDTNSELYASEPE